jgi:hypothetical protein
MTKQEEALFNEKLNGITTLINARFTNVDNMLEAIHTEAKRTNGRVSKLEEFKEITQSRYDRRLAECPNAETIKKIDNSLLEYNFILKYPKLFVFALAFVIIITLSSLAIKVGESISKLQVISPIKIEKVIEN